VAYGQDEEYDEYINAENEEIKATLSPKSSQGASNVQIGEIARIIQQTESDDDEEDYSQDKEVENEHEEDYSADANDPSDSEYSVDEEIKDD